MNTGNVPPRPGIQEVADVMAEHLRLISAFHGPSMAPVIFRKLFVWYTKGFRDVKPLKDRVFRAKTEAEMLELIVEFRGNEPHAGWAGTTC
jgi:tRNA-dihydrouridine synthase